MAFRAPKDDAAQNALHFLQELLGDYHPRNFSIETWDGRRWEPEAGQFRRFAWKINRPEAVRAVFAAPSELALAEAYIYGDFDIEGDIWGVFPLADYLLQKDWSENEKLHLGGMLFALPSARPSRPQPAGVRLRGRPHSKERDRQTISYHYDVSNDFYALWLGRDMQYSCAYFIQPDDHLDSAQRQKLDYICRKLRLQPGECLLDIGCGWGGLVLHAARYYGVQALGVTLSQQQLAWAQERIRQSGLAESCEVKLLDYRDLETPGGYDKLVSVGMIEHVGETNLPEYFRRAFQLLRPGGVFLNHGIGIPESRRGARGRDFCDTYVFPDGEFVSIGTMTHHAEQAGFEVRDVENLREHYALTLRHWVRGMEDEAGSARRLVDEVTYRIWRLHMAGSAHYFETGKLDLYQTFLVKTERGRSGLPLTRADWYA
jgi:cyclopropane-fatty-acyl-phospholipid synthase